MFDIYEDIFNHRGQAYHAAMRFAPLARKREFEFALRGAGLAPGDTVCDLPSGGGYLSGFIDVPQIKTISVENTHVFYEECRRLPGVEARLCPLDATGLSDGSADYVVSLAGLHHAANRRTVFVEMNRILAPGKNICIADVVADSAVAWFLDEFVDAHNSMGHTGDFFHESWIAELAAAGFAGMEWHEEAYTWDFSGEEEMTQFCRLLFGLDLATPQVVRRGIQNYLGYSLSAGGCRMNWGLAYLRAAKPC